MARKNFVKTFKMFDSQDISSNQTSSITKVLTLDKASVYVEFSGTPTGTLVVQATNDDVDNNESITWRDVNMGGVIALSGAAGSHDLVFNELPFVAIRLVYTATSGAGTMSATLTAKTVGA